MRSVLILGLLFAGSSAWAQDDPVQAATKLLDGFAFEESLLGESWFGMYVGGKNIGSFHTVVARGDAGAAYVVTTNAHMAYGGQERRLTETIELDDHLRLIRLTKEETGPDGQEVRNVEAFGKTLKVKTSKGGEVKETEVERSREVLGSMTHVQLLLRKAGLQARTLAFLVVGDTVENLQLTISGTTEVVDVRGQSLDLVRVEAVEDESTWSFHLDAKGRVVRASPNEPVSILAASSEAEAKADLSVAEVKGTALEAVEDFFMGAVGDDVRWARSADWEAFCVNSSRRDFVQQGIEPTKEQLDALKSPDSIETFKSGLRKSLSELNPEEIPFVIQALKVREAGQRSEVALPNGAIFVIEKREGAWKIVDVVPPAE